MLILAGAASLLRLHVRSVASALPHSLLVSSFAAPIRSYVRPTFVRTRKVNDRRRLRFAPYHSIFHIPSTASVRSLYRVLLRTAARFPDDLVRWYVAARCRNEWREHREEHRESYQAEQQAAYEKQKARLQVRERLQRIIAGEPDQAATQAALDMHFDPLQPVPLSQLHITTGTPHLSIDLRRTIHQRYKDAQKLLHYLQSALLSYSTNLIASRTRVLCAAYGWQGGPVLDQLCHLRNMYLNAPNMLQPHTLLALHPLHRYLVTGVRPEHERPMEARKGGRRPAVGVYEGWPIEQSDRLRGESMVSGRRWMECYRLLIMERCQCLDESWRRAYSDMLKQNQIIGAPGEIEQPGTAVAERSKTSRAKKASGRQQTEEKDGDADEESKTGGEEESAD